MKGHRLSSVDNRSRSQQRFLFSILLPILLVPIAVEKGAIAQEFFRPVWEGSTTALSSCLTQSSSFLWAFSALCLITLIVTVMYGITQQRSLNRVQQGQANSLFQLQILEHIHDAVVVTDLDGHITHWNAGAERIYGYTATEAIGQNAAMLYFPEDLPLMASRVMIPLRQQSEHEVELPKRHKSGKLIQVALRLSLMRDVHGTAIGIIGCSNDITQRKAIEQALQDSELRLSLALNAAKAGMWQWEMESDQAIWSDENFRLLGYEPGSCEVSYENWLRAVHPEDRAVAEAQIQQSLKHQADLNFEFRVCLPDGTVRWLADIGQVTCDRSGQTTGMIGIQIDITERKKAELALHHFNQALEARVQERTIALQQSEEKFRQLTENIREVFWLQDPDHEQLLYVSPAYEQLWGRSLNELYVFNQAWIDAIHPDDRERVRMAIAAIKEQPYDQEYRVVHSTGEIRWIRDRAFLIRDQTNRVYRVAGIAEDISDRKHAETALRESEAKYRHLINNLHAGVVVHAPDTRIVLSNATACDLLGLTIDQLMGKTAIDPAWHFLRDDGSILPSEEYPVNQVRSTRKPIRNYIVGIHRAADSIVWVLANAFPEFDANQQLQQIVVTFIDISDRKRAEEELRQERNLLSRIMETSPAGIAVVDAEGQIIFANTRAEQILGLSKNEVISRAYNAPDWYLQKIDGSAIPDDELPFKRVMQTGKSVFDSQHAIQWSNGQRVLLSINGAPSFNAANQVDSVVFTIEDITERKQSEEALHRTLSTNQALLNAIPDLILRVTRDGIYLDGIPTEDVSLVAPLHELVGKSVWEMLPTNLAQQRMYYIEQAFKTGTVQVHEYQFFIDGEWRDEEARIVVSGNHEAIILIRDITDRKRAELEIRLLNEALEAQNRNLEALVEQRTAELIAFFDAIPDYVYVHEGRELKFTFCNDRHAQLLGLESRHQLQYKTLFDAFPEAQARGYVEQNHRILDSGEPMRSLETWDLPIGKRYYDTIKTPLKRADGRVYGLIGVTRDITELVEARQSLSERTLQLEATNRELESFSYSVSHDLRAPLRHISGFVNALRQRLEGHDSLNDAKVAHYLQVIETSSQKMALLIDGLLTLSRIGRRQMECKPVNLRVLVDEAIAVIQPEVQDSYPVEFIIGDLPTVNGDLTLLQQVFRNLISNAVKFSRHHPTPRVEVNSLTDQTLFVKDNGVGFQMEYADKLFGAFQRLHAQSEFEGTGIGLAIVQRIIHRHGGTIWAESQPNQGAVFYFTLKSGESRER
ncbi:MAG TPA: PAS domain S-box protein [Crinalium sp.]|jgi:PAS domain S-box-containing protein